MGWTHVESVDVLHYSSLLVCIAFSSMLSVVGLRVPFAGFQFVRSMLNYFQIEVVPQHTCSLKT